jgi:hypothetical protein
MKNAPRIAQHHWAPFQPMVQAIESLAAGNGRVLEIGPGHVPFGPATVFVDWQVSSTLAGREVHVLDINKDPLPFADKSFDFVYCRHTLEDIYNPAWVCREMERVAHAGYVETPSPIVECCRGADAGTPSWRGYHHHRYVIWVEDGTLMFVPKYPIIEHLDFGDAESGLVEALNTSPMFWNTYFLWEGRLPHRMLQHDSEYKISEDYSRILLNAARTSVAQTGAIAERFFSEETSAA